MRKTAVSKTLGRLENYMANKSNDQNTAKQAKTPKDKYTWLHQLKRLPWLILIPIGLLLPKLVKNAPDRVERIYSRGIYPVIARILGFFSSVIPNSLAELIIIFLGGSIVIVLIVRLLKIPFGKLGQRRKNRVRFFSFLISLGIFAGIMLNLFYGLWAFNHYRVPLKTLMELDARARSKEEVAALYEYAASQAALYREQVEENAEGVFTLANRRGSLEQLVELYAEVGRENPLFKNKTYPAKTVIHSKTMSKLDIAGIYIPYTAEANVNAEQPDLYFVADAAHEMAHYIGFAKEDECNFIAYYVLTASDDPVMRYSAYMFALSYLSATLNSIDSKLYSELYYKHYTEGMKRDAADYRVYYKKYEKHPAQKVNNKVNDAYLKYNDQPAGIKSYGLVVDLLLAYHEKTGK